MTPKELEAMKKAKWHRGLTKEGQLQGAAKRSKFASQEEKDFFVKRMNDARLKKGAYLKTALQTDREVSEQLYHFWKHDPLSWAHVFFKHHFRMPTPELHLQIIKALMHYPKIACASPRESAKSTIVNFVYNFHGIIFKRFHFIVIGSSTFTKAAMYLETIKMELKENERLRMAMPLPVIITKDAEGDSDFRHADGFTTKVLCKGRDQIGSIRGVKFGAYRPDLLIWDDVEDDKMVENPILRLELERLYDEAWTPAGEKGRCQHVVIGTILHDDSQIAKMVVQKNKYTEYKKLFYEAHVKADTPEEYSLWPEKWTVDWLKELRRIKPLVYAKEMQNNPVAGTLQRFKQDDFRYWKMEHGQYLLFDEFGHIINTGSLRDCKAAISCDLAWEAKRESDFTVLFPGFLTPMSDLLLGMPIFDKGMKPNQVEEHLFSMVDRLTAITGSLVPVGMEKAKQEKVQKWLLKENMRKTNRFIHLKDLVWDTDKRERIEIRLQPRYNQHMVYHLHGMGEYEHQLLRFPSATHDDLPDAAQGLVQLLQFPKTQKVAPKQEDLFLRVRQHAIDHKRGRTGHKTFSGRRRNEIPAQTALLS